jgi:hypothetical protein
MRIITTLLLVCLICGCKHGWNTDVSQIPPHNKLTGTVWKLKTDAYVLEWGDHWRMYYIYPNTAEFSGVLGEFHISGDPYDESNIGRKVTGLKIVGGLRAGESIRVVRVLKNSHIEMGTTYVPMMIPEQENKWTGNKQLNGADLYHDRGEDGKHFDEQGILNPKYAEKTAE